jgi:hypothetical protein
VKRKARKKEERERERGKKKKNNCRSVRTTTGRRTHQIE